MSKKPEGTFEVRAFIPKTEHQNVSRWMIDNIETDKNIASGLIIEDYFNLVTKIDALIDQTKLRVETYSRHEILKVLEELL